MLQNRAFLAVVAVVTAVILFFATGCMYGGVELDPRDEAAVEEWENSQCNTRKPRVTLKVRVDPGVTGAEVWMRSRSGSQKRIGLMAGNRDVKLSRNDLEPGGYFSIRLGNFEVERVYMDLLSCDVGTLIIAYPLNYSFYMGADLDR